MSNELTPAINAPLYQLPDAEQQAVFDRIRENGTPNLADEFTLVRYVAQAAIGNPANHGLVLKAVHELTSLLEKVTVAKVVNSELLTRETLLESGRMVNEALKAAIQELPEGRLLTEDDKLDTMQRTAANIFSILDSIENPPDDVKRFASLKGETAQ